MTPVSRHVVWKMFRADTPASPEVIVAHTPNFKPNFKFLRLKFSGGPPFQLGFALGSLGQSVARVKISGRSTLWGPRCSLPRKIHLGRSMLANKTFLFVDQSSTDFFHRTRKESLSITFLSDFVVVPEIFAIKVESCKKSLWILYVFFAVPNFRGPAFQKLCICYDPYLGARRMETVLWGYSH